VSLENAYENCTQKKRFLFVGNNIENQSLQVIIFCVVDESLAIVVIICAKNRFLSRADEGVVTVQTRDQLFVILRQDGK
jgi:hypothetical protein